MVAKVVLITGCSAGGIGHELAKQFHLAGCRVYASARNVDKIAGLSPEITKISLDVTSSASIKETVAQIIKASSRIDMLVNNAGQGFVAPVIEADLPGVRQAFETNVFGLLAVTQEVAPGMIERGEGLIINIGSMVAYKSTPWGGIYCATKAAIHSLSDTMALELKNFGVKVMIVAPGAIKSLIGVANMERLAPETVHYQSVLDRIIARANTSQQNSTSGETLARTIVQNALMPSPPRYLTTGATSWKFSLMYYLPTSVSDWWVGRLYGSDQVKKVGSSKL